MIACVPPAHVSSEIAAEPRPVYEESRHHLVYENSVVRVLDVRIPAGDSTAFHIHANPIVAVVVADARGWNQTLGQAAGPVGEASAVPGILDNWDRALPYTHRVGNADTVPMHYVVAEWIRSPGIEAKVLPDDGPLHLEKEGRIARVYRVSVPPHGATTMHEHTAPGLTVLATDGVLVYEGDMPVATGGEGAGQWTWRNGGHHHVLRNPGDRPLIVYEIDWR